MISPTTRMRVLRAAVRSCRTRAVVSGFSLIERCGSTEECRERTGGAGPWLFGRETNFIRRAARFDSHFECDRDAIRVTRDRDGRVHEDRIGAHFHGFGSVAGRAKAGIDDDWNGRLLDNDANLVAGLDAAI